MAGSTTIRVDLETHAQLLELSAVGGMTLMETVREATDALRRRRFALDVVAEFAELRSDPVAWSEYVAEAESSSVTDGVDR